MGDITRLNPDSYEWLKTSGVVHGTKKWAETKIWKTGGVFSANNTVYDSTQIHSRAVECQEFWVRDDEGKDTKYRVTADVADGQRVTVISMQGVGDSTPVALYNYQQRQLDMLDEGLIKWVSLYDTSDDIKRWARIGAVLVAIPLLIMPRFLFQGAEGLEVGLMLGAFVAFYYYVFTARRISDDPDTLAVLQRVEGICRELIAAELTPGSTQLPANIAVASRAHAPLSKVTPGAIRTQDPIAWVRRWTRNWFVGTVVLCFTPIVLGPVLNWMSRVTYSQAPVVASTTSNVSPSTVSRAAPEHVVARPAPSLHFTGSWAGSYHCTNTPGSGDITMQLTPPRGWVRFVQTAPSSGQVCHALNVPPDDGSDTLSLQLPSVRIEGRVNGDVITGMGHNQNGAECPMELHRVQRFVETPC